MKDIEGWVKQFGGDSRIIYFSAEHEEQILTQPTAAGKQVQQKTEIPKIIKSGYNILDLINFFTIGSDEVRSWSIRNGLTV